jgi:hypothetical protein
MFINHIKKVENKPINSVLDYKIIRFRRKINKWILKWKISGPCLISIIPKKLTINHNRQ